jgi:hypothetical protein
VALNEKQKWKKSMKIIYKGTLHEDIVITPTVLDGARLYNRAMQVKVDMQLTLKGSCLENGTLDPTGSYKLYDVVIQPSNTVDPSTGDITFYGTASVPQGIYNLELFSYDASNNPVIEGYYDNYAKVVESSFTKEYA